MLHEKYSLLLDILRGLGNAAVAFSAGTDSTLLLYAAKQALGENVLAVTLHAAMFPEQDLQEAKDFCAAQGIRHTFLQIDEQEIDGFRENPPERCYLCKRVLFSRIREIAGTEGIRIIADGTNADDAGDYRPGMRALAELGIRSPLREAGLTKREIRQLLQEMGLPAWNKPSAACLASRVPYGEEVTPEKLRMVGAAEIYLHSMGFEQVRVRIHSGNLARIEVLPAELERLLLIREQVVSTLKQLGFLYVCTDLQGYRTGSLNEVLHTQT